jgi:sporulation protein YlmC with PRC-barrel domain
MALHRLSELEDWHVSDRDEDIRGREIYARGGDRLGKVEDMLVDTDAELVRTIILDNGERYSVEDIEIENDGVFLETKHDQPHRAVRVYSRDIGTDRPRRAR